MSPRPPSSQPIGVWLVGAGGNLATTVVLGARALAHGLCEPIGMVTESPALSALPFAGVADMAFGGHEVRGRSMLETAAELVGPRGFLDGSLVKTLAGDLQAAQEEVRPGTLLGASPAVHGLLREGAVEGRQDDSGDAAVARLAGDIVDFRERLGLARVIVVNLASTEPVPASMPDDEEGVAAALSEPGGGGLPPSTLYALAACLAGCPYVNFTPSTGASPPAIQRIFQQAGLPHAGCDGKTGETLVKSALAPLFSVRNLRVLSWTGQNILGNRDGEVLSDPDSREAKLRSKSGVVTSILGYAPEQRVGIDYVGSLGDWKVAWDYIHFEGFLGTPMRMQFVWEGCDSALAAPLVLDLVRLVDRAFVRGEAGVLRSLGVFFKSPLGVESHGLVDQYRALLASLSH